MKKTKIEWCDYSINPVKGLCPMACPYCYARRMYKRFKWNERIEWDEQCLLDLRLIKSPSRIFVGSTMELFGGWVSDNALKVIFQYVRDFPQHTFIFLTKKPENLIKWSPFPENCWVGESVTHDKPFIDLLNIKASVRFLSFEPLLGHIDMTKHSLKGINWLIIGQQTPVKASTQPKIEWVKEIVEAADKAGIPVFLKENLRPLFIPNVKGQPNALMDNLFWSDEKCHLRQEFPMKLEV